MPNNTNNYDICQTILIISRASLQGYPNRDFNNSSSPANLSYPSLLITCIPAIEKDILVFLEHNCYYKFEIFFYITLTILLPAGQGLYIEPLNTDIVQLLVS